MASNDLRHLSRLQLIEVIDALTREVTDLTQQRDQLLRDLENRAVTVGRAGSIAEAALSLNGVFDSAQRAADQYVLSVKASLETMDPEGVVALEASVRSRKIVADAQARADAILAQAREEAQLIHAQALRDAKRLAEPQPEDAP